MLREVIVVEGKSDIARVTAAVSCDCIATEGYTLRPEVLAAIRVAYEKRGIIILTDPDGPGNAFGNVFPRCFPAPLTPSCPKTKPKPRRM